jgi:hypothetical protein
LIIGDQATGKVKTKPDLGFADATWIMRMDSGRSIQLTSIQLLAAFLSRRYPRHIREIRVVFFALLWFRLLPPPDCRLKALQ